MRKLIQKIVLYISVGLLVHMLCACTGSQNAKEYQAPTFHYEGNKSDENKIFAEDELTDAQQGAASSELSDDLSVQQSSSPAAGANEEKYPPFDLSNDFFWGDIELWGSDTYYDDLAEWDRTEYAEHMEYWQTIDFWNIPYQENKTWSSERWLPTEKYIIWPDLQLNGVPLLAEESEMLKTVGEKPLSITEVSRPESERERSKVYEFGSGLTIELETGGKMWTVWSITATTPKYKTSRGLKVGDTIQTLVALYGVPPGGIGDNIWSYTSFRGNYSFMSFTVEKGVVKAIRIFFIVM